MNTKPFKRFPCISDPNDEFGEEGAVPPSALKFDAVPSISGVDLDNVQTPGGSGFAAGVPSGFALVSVPAAYKSAWVEGKTEQAKGIGNLPEKG